MNKDSSNDFQFNNLTEKRKFLSKFKGISQAEATKKLHEQKKNNKINNTNKTVKDIVFSNLFTFLNLLVIMLVTIIIKIKRYEQLFFLFVNFLNFLISVIQETRAKKTLDKISLFVSDNANVIRDGKLVVIPINNVVLEDILYLESGSQIAADSVIIEGNLEVDESFLTGESKPVLKKERDFLYSGSYIISGKACVKVIAVCGNTYISQLTKKVKKYKKIQTPLMKTFSNLVLLIIFLLIPTFTMLLLSLHPGIYIIDHDFMLGLCGFILGMMPSGLMLLMSLTSVIGLIRLSQKNAYMKDLFGIEMLAQINFLCLDKTGTITDGTMKVKKILFYENIELEFNTLIANIIKVFPNNNPTQNALNCEFLCSKNINSSSYKIKNFQYFSSLRKYSAVEFDQKGTFVLGAPEFILKNQFVKIKEDVEKNTKLGYRVLLLAQTNSTLDNINTNNTDFRILSLILLEDKIRKDVSSTIKYFQKLGIKIKIISGDSYLTISHIAKRIGLIISSEQSVDLTNLSSQQIASLAFDYDVFGRATPEQKQILISSLRKNNNRVAMIGDGVNDILAFKESDMSIAMASGSKVAQNIANLVLIDSKFASLPQVMAEGRRVINNLEKNAVAFFTKCILSFLLAVVTIFNNWFFRNNMFFPFAPLQFNLIDIFFIGIPSFFLSFELNDKKLNPYFIRSIVKASSFYALFIGLHYIFLLYAFPMNQTRNQQVSCFMFFITSFIFANILFKNCLPFNKSKILLFSSMILFFCLLGYFFFWPKNVFKSSLHSLLEIIYSSPIFLLYYLSFIFGGVIWFIYKNTILSEFNSWKNK
ncbi:HAD-IC family P-type ATPase [Candidatus Phytoplasma melaleucae]|uniref:HAD-IC family P-type ATPase n=1 Tax=Candidatus Phytoplasma melaleucae TaxID=2982630 RepID=A0ABT9DEE8_9MOLU|nr:HAD-IC family P-type ATPase ['Melaleuca sp.' phytoplasma]MDO8168188.1 HAD-IC family P-type ATPase ['Melaleuca sp.' phytoplasma]